MALNFKVTHHHILPMKNRAIQVNHNKQKKVKLHLKVKEVQKLITMIRNLREIPKKNLRKFSISFNKHSRKN